MSTELPPLKVQLVDGLVKRLRAAVSEKFVGRTGDSCVAGLRKDPICQAAADEIERLRAELAEAKAEIGQLKAEFFWRAAAGRED